MISAWQFCDVFREQWKREYAGSIRSIYRDEGPWTEFMLGNGVTYQNSFLYRVSERLSLQMRREWYRLDCVYYQEETNLYGDLVRPGQTPGGGVYPACLPVLIEHENGEHVEEEMYKLLIFRSPLKVLIFYDYDEDRKTTDGRRTWLQKKLSDLLKMRQRVDSHWPEADNTEYLFLVGSRVQEGQLPRWRYFIVNGGRFSYVDTPPPLVFLC